MRMPALKKFVKRPLQIGLPLAILAGFLYQVKNDWSNLTAHTFQWNPWLLALAFAGFLLQELSYGLIWQSILARLGSRLDLRTSLRIYLASEFVRYIPGNVWHVLTRILWVSKYGVSRPIAFASMTIELITKLAAGALVFAVSLLFWHDLGAINQASTGTLIVAVGVVTIFGLLVVLYPPVLNGLLNFALRLLKREPVVLTLRYKDILLITLAWCVSWLVAGCAFYILLLALWPATPLAALPICIGIYAIAWDVGFVSFITPSGLGFREATIIGLFALALPLPAGLGTIIAFLSRLVSTMAELLCVSIAYLSGIRQVRAVQQQASPGDNNGGKETHPAETSMSVTVEGGTQSE
jgi:glycosyltransferase 2 family protein